MWSHSVYDYIKSHSVWDHIINGFLSCLLQLKRDVFSLSLVKAPGGPSPLMDSFEPVPVSGFLIALGLEEISSKQEL